MKKVFFESSLGKENNEVLGFKTIDALEKEIESLTKEVEKEQDYLSYND